LFKPFQPFKRLKLFERFEPSEAIELFERFEQHSAERKQVGELAKRSQIANVKIRS
jgi:hypothetical protein